MPQADWWLHYEDGQATQARLQPQARPHQAGDCMRAEPHVQALPLRIFVTCIL